MLFNYGDIHVMGMKRNLGETIEVASLYIFSISTILKILPHVSFSTSLGYSSLVIGSSSLTIHSFLTIDCSSLTLVIVSFQCCLLLLLFNMHVVTRYHHFLFLYAYWNSIVSIFGLVPPLYYWFLLFDTCNYSFPHTSVDVFALNKSWVQLTFRFSK